MKTPVDKSIVFTLYSHPMKDAKERWKAHLTFEPGSTDETDAILDIVDGEGTQIDEATFEFAGASIMISHGIGRLKCADFVKGKREGGIWLHRKGAAPVPGALTFE